MEDVSRRKFIAISSAAVAMVHAPAGAVAATQCISGSLPSFLPAMLTVDCASRRNFKLFRQNSAHLGLAGVVNMSVVRGKLGTYQAGNLFLFPWLKPQGVALKGKVWNSVVPVNATAVQQASPIPGSTLPQDDYFCNFLLGAPPASFIGLLVDTPASKLEARLGLYTNVDKLADGKPVGIDWASSNLNHPWFGGSRAIPAKDTCNGAAWRKLIVAGLSRASTAAC